MRAVAATLIARPLAVALPVAMVGPSEFCDDGFTDACGSCNADCSAAERVPSVVMAKRAQNLSSATTAMPKRCGNADCSAAGTAAVCGDGTLCPELEFCDDGNTDACDGCYGDCSQADNVCGDAILECAETCDDNAVDDGNGCSAACQREGSCGDGILQPLFEFCDDGFTDACGTATRTAPERVQVQPAATVKHVLNWNSATMASPMLVVPATLIVARRKWLDLW